jgi:hypothetical protein
VRLIPRQDRFSCHARAFSLYDPLTNTSTTVHPGLGNGAGPILRVWHRTEDAADPADVA